MPCRLQCYRNLLDFCLGFTNVNLLSLFSVMLMRAKILLVLHQARYWSVIMISIKLSRVRIHTPNRTPCSKSYSYSRSRGYKTFPYSYFYSRRVQIGDFLSKFHSNNTQSGFCVKYYFQRPVVSGYIQQVHVNFFFKSL